MNEAAEDLRQALASAHRRLTAQDARLRELELVLSSISTIRADGGASVVWDRTFSLLRSALDFNLAVVLESSQGEFVCSASSNCALIGARWPSGPLFQRVASGNGAVAPDISRLPEWASGDPRASVGSVGAVLAPIVAHEGNGLLVLCGARHGEYAVSDLALVWSAPREVIHPLS